MIRRLMIPPETVATIAQRMMDNLPQGATIVTMDARDDMQVFDARTAAVLALGEKTLTEGTEGALVGSQFDDAWHALYRNAIAADAAAP